MTGFDDEVPDPALRPGDRLDSDRLDNDRLNGLIAAVARGEHGAFDETFRQLSDPIYRMALAVLRDPAQAEEVAQEVLIEIWRKGRHHDPDKSNAVAWALMITRRRAIDRIRASTATVNRERRKAMAETRPYSADETMQDAIEREQLHSYLSKLSDVQRRVIVLAFFGGYTYAEIAVILDVALGTVKSRARMALANLRVHMRDSD